MIVGILKEIKKSENRVSMTPDGTEVMVENGHDVLVEKSAGVNNGFPDEMYVDAGAVIIDTAAEYFGCLSVSWAHLCTRLSLL
jgi:alanine dehydrogenase